MVKILDTTLREGEQTPGVYFRPHVKLAIANQLDKIGIDYIEAGHPIVSPKIKDAITTIANGKLNAIIAAHSRSIEREIDTALECGVDFIGIFYCVSDKRLNNDFNKNLSQAIDQITRVISYAKKQKPDLIVRYTPEDTVRSEFENVVKASVAAVDAGADIISIADTTGYMIPGVKGRSMYEFVLKIREEFYRYNKNPKLAVHCHDDRGLAIANAIDAYRAGADIIDTTVLKLGERAGLVDLATLLTVLATDFDETNSWNLRELSPLYNLVSQHSGVSIPINLPIMGENAFKHCAGLHTNAARKDPTHYQSIKPEIVGRRMEVSLDNMSGLSSVRFALDQIEVEHENNLESQVLKHVKEVGETGRIVNQQELRQIVNWIQQGGA